MFFILFLLLIISISFTSNSSPTCIYIAESIMNSNLSGSYRRSGDVFNIGLLFFSVVPLIALSFYNHPSAVDDYCFIYTVREHGWIGGMSKYYNEWTGRYFSIFLTHSSPLIFNFFAGYKLLSFLLVLGLLGSIYLLTRTILPAYSRLAHLGFTGVIMFLFLLRLPSVPEAFYWAASFANYTLPGIMILLWIVLTIQWYRAPLKQKKNLIAATCSFLVFAIIGCSETAMLVMVVLIGSWLFYRLVIIKKLDMLMMLVMVTALFSCYLLFSAPGNTARLEGNPISGDIPMATLATIRFIAKIALDWLTGTPILLFTLCWVWVIASLKDPEIPCFAPPVWLVLMSYPALLFVVIFPSFYAISTELDPTPRVVNSLYFFFLLGWFYLSGALAYRVRAYILPFFSGRKLTAPALYGICALSIVLSVKSVPNFKTMYRDWLKGKAGAYDREMKERYAILMDKSNPSPIIPPIRNRPESLFVGDIEQNPRHWWNWCMAGYFGKDSIRLSETGPSADH